MCGPGKVQAPKSVASTIVILPLGGATVWGKQPDVINTQQLVYSPSGAAYATPKDN